MRYTLYVSIKVYHNIGTCISISVEAFYIYIVSVVVVPPALMCAREYVMFMIYPRNNISKVIDL